MQLPQFKLELNHDEPLMGGAKCKTTWKRSRNLVYTVNYGFKVSGFRVVDVASALQQPGK